jgi:outer membrane protein
MKQMPLFRFFSLILFIGLSTNVLVLKAQSASQAPWSLKQCIDYARENNLTVKKQFLQVQLSREDLKQSKASFLPSINGSATHVYNWGQTIDQYTNQFATERVRSNNFNLSADMDLFSGFQKLNRLRMMQTNLKISQLQVEKTVNDISLNVATYYLQVLFYIELKKTTEAQLAVTKEQVERTRKMVNAGSVAQGELFNIEAQAATEEQAVAEANNNLNISYLTLAQLLDVNDDPNFSITIPDLSTFDINQPLPDPMQVYQLALGNQPEVKASELGVISADQSLKSTRGSAYPTISLSASWGTGYSGAAKRIDTIPGSSSYGTFKTIPFSDQLTQNENKSAGLFLRVPIFNGYQSRTAIQKAKIGLESARIDLEITKNNLLKVVQQAYADALAAQSKYGAANKKVNASRESFHYAEQKIAVGMMTSYEYNESKKNLVKAESDLLQARFDFIFKMKVLDFYMGRELTIL